MSENQIEIIGQREVELLEKNRQINLQKLFTPEGMDAIIGTIKKEVADFEADVSTKEGRAKIVSMARKIACCKSPIKELATELKEDSRKFIDGVNAQLKRYETEMDTLRDEIRKPVDEIEEKEAADLAEKQNRIARIDCLRNPRANFGVSTSIDCQAALDEVRDLVNFDWGDFSFKVETLAKGVIEILKEKLAAAKKYEADQAELAQLKKEAAERAQKDHEEKIAREAAEKAKREAEEKLAANKCHRAKINKEALKVIATKISYIEGESRETRQAHYDSEYAANIIIEAIAKGEVPHVQINY